MGLRLQQIRLAESETIGGVFAKEDSKDHLVECVSTLRDCNFVGQA